MASFAKPPQVLKKVIPTMDVSALETLVKGVSFPVAGSITVDIALPQDVNAPAGTLRIMLETNP